MSFIGGIVEGNNPFSAGVTPNKITTLQIGPGITSCHIDFDVPGGYTMYIDGKAASSIDFSSAGDTTGLFQVVVRKDCSCYQSEGTSEVGASPGARLDRPIFEVSMGTLSDGRLAGSVMLDDRAGGPAQTPNSLIYSPPANTNEVEVINNANGLRQIRSPQALLDVSVISSGEYDIRFYRIADVGSKVNGLYTFSGQPFVTWKIKSLNPLSQIQKDLQISRIQNGVTTTSQLSRDHLADRYISLITGGGATTETRTITTSPTGNRVETTSTKEANGVKVAKVVKTFHANRTDDLIQEVVDPDGAALTTVYSYYENSSELGRYKKLQSISKPDGSWEKYDYDSKGNMVLLMRPWKDLSLAAATEATSHATYYTYEYYNEQGSGGGNVSLLTKRLLSVEEKVAGTLVSRKTYSRSQTTVNGEPATAEDKTVYSSAQDSQTIKTITYSSSAFSLLSDRVAVVEHPDDRKDTYSYEKGNYVTNVDPALNQFVPNVNGQSLREAVVYGTKLLPDGIAMKTTKDVTVLDQYGNKVLQETYVYTGAGYERIGWTVFTYDSRGHMTQSVSHTGAYSSATGQLISVSDGVQTTTFEYYPATHPNAGRIRSKTYGGNKSIYFKYNSRGELIQTWGDAIYPVEFQYNEYGQQIELHTFRGGFGWQSSTWPTSTTGTVDVTRFIYDDATGLLTQRQDAASKQHTYTYDAMGRLKTRTWARLSGASPLVTTYSYNSGTGELSGVSYSDSTPAVTLGHDRAGRQNSVNDASGAHSIGYNAAGEMQSAQITGGILDGVQLSIGYDSFLRRSSFQASRSSNWSVNQSYTYDVSSRLSTVTSGALTATYSYYPNSGLLNSTSFTGGATIARSYDSFGRLQLITTTPASGGALSSGYTYNNIHHRTRVTREDNSYWSFAYNDRGELVSGKKYWSDNTAVAGQQFEYAFDNIGNRVTAKAGGNAQGSGLRQSGYSADSLNQYLQRSVPGAVDVQGTADSAATVTVNNQATYRRTDYFHKELALDNSAGPVFSQVSMVGVKNNAGPAGEDVVSQQGGNVYLPHSTEAYTYDADGNLTSDGRWSYAWDAENRLVSMQAISSVPAAAKMRLEFAYDYMGRRVRKQVYVWNSGTASYQLQATSKFIYDGWYLIAELDGNSTLVRSYVWGQDVSGSLQGAGGIGGLLMINDASNSYIAGYDGNGNVTAFVKASTGTISASYEYDPFGSTVRATGEYSNINPFRFATKYTDSETGLLYYGYRFYNPQTGRWLSRDPIEEERGNNLYAFVMNDAVDKLDALGHKTLSEWAEQKMWDLYHNRSNAVGSKYPGDKTGRDVTDCITYSMYVLEYAYQKIGRKDIANQILQQSKLGTKLAAYLTTLGWKAYYWNPDVDNPKDGRKDPHRISYYLTKKSGKYYGIPISGYVINYNPTPAQHRETPKTQDGFDRLSEVRFAYGVARGGDHTFLFSYGMVYEAHWTAIGDDVYARKAFYYFEWLSGAILIPPDIRFEGNVQ